MNDEDWLTELDPFEVSDSLIQEVLREGYSVDEIEGYQGQPITGVGDVYTPPNLVDFILDSVGYKSENSIEQLRVVDLSCGTGSFIAEIVRRLRERLVSSGYSPTEVSGARQIISIIKNNIVALDTNSMAVWRTAQLVLYELREEIKCLPQANPIDTLPIYHANSLMPNLEIDDQHFDLVVGNPPYIKNKDISGKLDEIYRREYECAVGKYDIYSLFFEKAIQVLSLDGTIGYVTPDRFHRTKYGEPLRKMISANTHLDLILNLNDDPFPVVNAYPTITIATKQDTSFPNYHKPNQYIYCEANSDELEKVSELLATGGCSNTQFCAEYDQENLSEKPWRFTSPQHQSLKTKLQRSMTPLGDLPLKIRTGVATGADDVYILGEKDARRMENDLIYPVIRGKNIKRGHIEKDSQYIICPYNSDGTTVDLDQHPAVNEYLSHHKNQLEQRYCVREGGKKWFETHDKIKKGRELEERIVTPDIAKGARFAITDGEISHNSCYSIHYEGNQKALAAILNSSPLEFLLKTNLPKMDDGYWRQMKRDMVNIPVINPSQLDSEVLDRLCAAYDERNWLEVDTIVYNVTGLSPKEKKHVKVSTSSNPD